MAFTSGDIILLSSMVCTWPVLSAVWYGGSECHQRQKAPPANSIPLSQGDGLLEMLRRWPMNGWSWSGRASDRLHQSPLGPSHWTVLLDAIVSCHTGYLQALRRWKQIGTSPELMLLFFNILSSQFRIEKNTRYKSKREAVKSTFSVLYKAYIHSPLSM